MIATKKITENRDLAYKFSDIDLQEMGEELADMILEYDNVEVEKKMIMKMYNDNLKSKMKQIKSLSQKIDDGFEIIEVSCEIIYNEPEQGQKMVIRQDTMESWTESMTHEEIQLAMPDLFSYDNNVAPWDEEE